MPTTTITISEGEYILTEKEMQDKYLCKAEAARWIGVTHQTINNWCRDKKIRVDENKGVPLTEVVRMMNERAA